MAGKDEYSSPLMQLVVSELKKNKRTTFADVRAAAAKKKLTLYPITFGRAKALLGLVKVAKRGQGKAARARAAAGPKRGPGRPRKNGSPAQLRAGRRGPGRPPKSSYGTFAPRRGPGRPRKIASVADSLD